MSTEPSIARQRGFYPKLWYLLLPLVAYPLLLVAVRDPLHAFSDFRQYARPAVFALRYEEQLLAVAFSTAFIASYALLLVRSARLRFVTLGTIAAAVFYPIITYIATQYYVYLGRPFAGAFSPAGRGYLMFLAAGCAIIAVVRTSPVLRAEFLGGRPAPSFGQAITFFAIGFGLIAMAYLCPLLLISLEVFPTVSHIRVARLVELMDTSPFSALAQLSVLIGAAVFSGIFSILVINVSRLVFWISVVLVSSLFYNLLTYSYGQFAPKLCKSVEISLCMSYLENGFLFALSLVFSLLIFQSAVRYFRELHPYRYS